MGGEVTDEGGQQTNGGDGHHEAGPAVTIVGWGNESKQQLPEDRQEVHDIIKTGRETFLHLSVLLLLVVIVIYLETDKNHLTMSGSVLGV